MKLKFKKQAYQDEAVAAVVDCFKGQRLSSGISYRIDPGRGINPQGQMLLDDGSLGFKNANLAIPSPTLLQDLQAVQLRQGLPVSTSLKQTPVCDINLDVEMETGTGKTYCYIKTMFELNVRYGWSKFIVVVPSIAIREGVHKSLEITAEHFLEQYHKRARFFIYNSKQLHNLESFSSDAGINVMVINTQAFNARGEDARRIRMELDDFQSRKPIDIIAQNRPILILDEPQKMGGASSKTTESLAEFKPLMILRYSATHAEDHNKVHRLDALDAYNQKLVKKISVRGISVRGLAGTNAYLYLESIEVSTTKPPEARLEIEIRQNTGIKRVLRKIGKGVNLHELSGGLDQYKGFVVADINALDNTLSFTNGSVIHAGEATGDVTEAALRRIQIREAIRAHFEKEQQLFAMGLKVLTLFFIDEVAKYRAYDAAGGELPGEYAQMFEEEYNSQLNEVLTLEDSAYNRYLRNISTAGTHKGYFSIDKKSKRLLNPKAAAKTGETEDVDAYDLILKDKERLLSFEEPVRFLFSHSALREGWDNPNVFVICTLKHSDNSVTRRQEVGRGMRLAVNQNGDRMDDPATVHQVNLLTVVASESYKDFVTGLQKDLTKALAARPMVANEAYFTGKVLKTEFSGEVTVTPAMAKAIYRYLVKNDYTDAKDHIAEAYVQAKRDGTLASLPAELQDWGPQVFRIIDTLFSEGQLPEFADERKVKSNPLNANFHKQEFQELWSRINRKAAYTVHFETAELIEKCLWALERELQVTPLQYTVQKGEQAETTTFEELKRGTAFGIQQTKTENLIASSHSAVKYDLIGQIASKTTLTRRTVGTILGRMSPQTFSQYRTNPEDFIRIASRLIREQMASVIIEHLTYDPVEDSYSVDIFAEKAKADFSRAVTAKRHIYDYVFTDSATERTFVEELDSGSDVEVYAKLPRTFLIPTPVGNYNPDWAIAFKKGAVKHIYFVAETKGGLSSLELRALEQAKIDCARKFFAKISSDQVKYEVVRSYAKLMEIVK